MKGPEASEKPASTQEFEIFLNKQRILETQEGGQLGAVKVKGLKLLLTMEDSVKDPWCAKKTRGKREGFRTSHCRHQAQKPVILASGKGAPLGPHYLLPACKALLR